ncbi:peptidoglycan DD-metalloendopeptidase family protein [Candidatus Woesebacteria bacterium]|nr:peptidoglycan DD-metalloendopeptidase family protein [Candidatus Woesebacteria bacterium]
MHATARRPLWVRVGAGLLATVLFLTNTVYPWISLLPAPPIVVAQESPLIASDSAEATPAASVATPAPSPLDPLDQLENEILLSTNSAEIVLPEEPPETSPSASVPPTPEVSPEDQILPPSATPTSTPTPSESPINNSTDLRIHGSTDIRDNGLTNSLLPPPLDPFLISLKYPFVGTYPISYGFGEVSSSSYVRLMQSIFDVDAHDGLDFAMPEGTSVLATGPGEVTHAGSGLYGITVIIKHSWGSSYYGHLSQTSVTVGDRVTTGQEIGLSGSTGVSTAPHLHFGIRPNHYDPYNGYRGMIDPLPYLTGTVLGTSTKHDLIHLPYKTLDSSDTSLSIPIMASSSSTLTYTLKNPRGESKLVYPSIYNYGTGNTAILPRPTPFIPGEYTLTVTNLIGESDVIKFSWGVLTLNTNQSRYKLGQTVKLALAVLDEVGEMVCDADLILNVTSPTGAVETLTTDNTLITRNIAVCQSKALTLTPDYEASFTPSEVGTHNITLTAITPKHTFTMTDSFEVVDTLPYTLERLTTTRIFPGNIYPVILKVTAHQDLNSQLVEQVPNGFSTTPAGSTDFAPWVSPDDLATIHPSPYTRTENSSSQSLSWELDLKTNQNVILGYTYDAPDESPALYSLGPISYAGATEARSWNLAIDGVDPTVGAFAPQTGVAWTSAGNANLSLRQPSPKNGDLMVAIIAIRPSASTVDTPSGWTLVDSQTGTDGGAEAADTGSVGLYWFSKVADGTEGTANQTFTETGTTSVWIGQIIKFRSSTGTYDLSSGGYSLNADATNWNGTLDTDIGTKDGDLILIAGAQNGDLSNTSAWNISATNLTTKSTVNEYFEGTTTTGNDVEVGIAETHIWEGNNTTTPTITLTQSVAASGAVMALRIRQGSGTNRTDTWVRSSGPFAVGTTSVAPAYPDLDIGDMLILVVGSRGTTDPTPTTPTGWTLIGSSYNGGAGAFAADAGNARITTYSREATSRLTGTQSVTITSGNTAHGQIYAINRDNAEGWTISSGGGTDTTAGTGYSVTTSSVSLDSASGGDVILVASSINTDAYTYTSLSLTQTGSTIATPTEEAEYRGTTGNDMGLHVASTEVTSGSGSGAATFSMTGSGSTASAPAGATIVIKILGTAQTVATKAVGFFTPPATWTSAGNANLSLTYPDPRDGDLMVAVTAIRPAASTVDTPAGWTLVDSRTGTDGGAEAADTGSVGIYVFSKTSDGTEGTGTLAFTETGTTSVWIGNIMKVRSGTGTYSVSASGYSLNGDTVTWGSTLGADIGLTNGDLVLLASAQNGDLSATSAWDISATGVTQKSTFNEHGEFGSTTGNDIEVGLASGMIWGGTNSATPTLTLTQSAAASGVVSAIRIREDTGTQRTDTWVRSASAQVVSTTTTLSLVYPEHEVGDMFVMFVSTRGTSDPTILDPYGWTSLGSYNGGAGTFGVDAGNARTTAYYREATSRRWGTQAVALTSADVAIGQILAIHTKNIDTWTIDSDGGTDTSAGTSWSVTGSGIDLSSSDGGDVVLIGSAINTDAYTYTSHALSASGITFGEVTQTATYNTTSGNDNNLTIVTSRVTAGSGTGVAPTLTMTSSGSTANAPAGSSLFVKIVGISSVMTVSGTANGNDGATVKVALGASVQAQTTTISSGTWTIADVTKPSIGTAVTVWVDSVADNLESTAITLYNSSPVSDLVLNTNVLTLGSNQDQSLSLTNLNSYDCSEDEDIMHQAASSHLKVEGDACAGSTTNSYSSEKLAVLSGDTLALATSETITTHDLENAGTITVTGNGTLNVSHDWANTGTFTAGTSTVNLTGGDSTTQTISGNTSFYNLAASTTSNSTGRTIEYTAGTTTTVTGTWTATGTSTKILTLESSTVSTWIITPTAASVNYVSVSYSKNHGVDFCATNTTDGGNNTRWRTTCEPTAQGFQRKTFFDDQNSRYWRFSTDGTDIDAEYSSDGTSWSASTTLPYNTNDFSVEYKSISGTEYVYLAIANNYDIIVRQGTLGASSVTWDSDVATILNGTSGSDSYNYSSLALDIPTSGSPKLWVLAKYYNGSSSTLISRRTTTTADTDPSTWTYDTATTLRSGLTSSDRVFGTLSPTGSSNMYAVLVYNTNIYGCRWVNSSTEWQDGSGDLCSAQSGGSWYNTSWDFRTKLTIDNTKLGNDVTDYPLFIDLSDLPAGFHTNVNQTDARDIRITKADGTTELPREVVFYDNATDTGELHAKYTGTLSSGSATDIYIYYGNAAASDYATTDTYGRNNVWTNSYAAVYHLRESGNGTTDEYKDSVGTNDGTGGNGSGAATPTTNSGQLDSAQDFDGTDDFIQAADDASLDITSQITVSAWVYSDGAQDQFDKIVAKEKNTYYPFQFAFNGAADDKVNFTVSDSTQDRSVVSDNDIPTTTWTHVTGTYDGSTVRLYVGAAAQASTYNGSFSIETNNNPLLIGGRTGQFFNGRIDELRISSTARTSGWITTEYNNQNNPNSFYSSFGTEEPRLDNADSIDTTPTGISDNLSLLSDGTNLHLAYVDDETTDQISYRKYSSGSWSASTLVADAASNDDTYPTISLDTTNGDLYVLWIDGATSDVIYSSCDTTTSCDTAGEWATEVNHDSTGSNVQLTSNISAAGKIFFVYSDGTTFQWSEINLTNPIGSSFQRKTWHDGTRYWKSSYDPIDSRIEFEYSSDGTSWTENTTARLTSIISDYSIEADSSNLFIVYSASNDIKGRVASSYPGTGFGWGSEQVILNGTSNSDSYNSPVISRDSSSYVWVAARYTGTGVYFVKTIKEAGATNDLPEDSGDTTYSLANVVNTDLNVYANLVSIGSQNMYISFIEDDAIQGCRWVNASTDWQDGSGNSCVGGGLAAPTQVSATADTTTTSTTYTLMDSMTITPGAGDYMAHFSTTVKNTDITTSYLVNASVFVNGAQITHTERDVYNEESWDTGDIASLPITIHAYLPGVTAGQAIEVRWKTEAGTALAHERTLIVEPVDSANISQATATGNTTTTSATDTQLDSMTLTPGAGDYMVYFSGSLGTGTTEAHIYSSIYVNGSQVTHSERDLFVEASYATPSNFVGMSTHAYVSGVGAGQVIEVMWRTTAGTASSRDRTLVVQKVVASSVAQATATSDTTTTSTSDVQVNSMSLTPGAGDYLVFFSSSVGNTFDAGGANQYISIYNNSSQVGHSERQLYTEDSMSSLDTSFPVSSQAYITSVGASDVVEIKWRTTTGTMTGHERTLTLVKILGAIGATDSVGTGTNDTTTTLSSVADASGNVHLTYINSSGHTIYRERTSSWQTPVTLDSNAGNAYPTLSINTTGSDLYAFWIRGDDIYYKKGVSTYTSGDWDTSATSWQAAGKNEFVTSNYSGANKIFAQWYDGSAVQWDDISIGGANTAPNSPTSLAQKTTGDVVLTTGTWHNSTSIKFTATATDTDNPDTLQLCVEIDQLGTGFSNTEDSCGTGGSYVGSGITITHTITVTDAQEYHWQARVKDLGGLYSSWVSYDVNAESARDIGVDTTAPTGGTVYDGTGVGVDSTFATNSLSALSANWASFSSNVSGLLRYDYSIGTTAGATDVKAWTDNTTSTTVTATGLTLQTSQMYFFNVRAVDNAGNVQSAVSSNGQLISPSISFAISPASATFSNLNAANSYTDTEVATLTTSTNAYNGYVIRAFTTDLLKSLGGTHQIANFSAGSYASPASWSGSETGFGYTSSDTTIQGSNKFSSGTLYAPFTQTGPGDIVADHTSTVTGTSISNEAFNITYKVKVPSDQAATNYTSTVVYTATAQY